MNRQRDRLLLAAALAAHVAAFVLIVQFTPLSRISTLNLYFRYGSNLQAGQVPYRDFVLEYPPLAAPLFWLPLALAKDLAGYRVAFAGEMLAFDLLGVCAALWGARRLALDLSPGWLVVWQPLVLVAMGRDLTAERFDLAPAALVLCALVLFAGGRARPAWITLALATALKLYPVVLAPLLAWEMWRQRAWRDLAQGAALFALTLLLSALVVTRGDLPALGTFFAYHAERGLEIETLYSSLLLIEPLSGHNEDAFGHQPAHGADELVAPAAPLFGALALPLTAIALAAVYLRHARDPDTTADPRARFIRLAQSSLLAILAFMLAGKLLSPQYLFWLYPFAGLLGGADGLYALLFGGAVLATRWLFPDHWGDLLALEPPAVIALIVRNALLLALGVGLFLWRGASRRPAVAPDRRAAT